jgi:LytS/YehU family sensor histidine kinase
MYQLLSDAYAAKGQWQLAFENRRQYEVIKDSIITQDRKVQLTQQMSQLQAAREKALTEAAFTERLTRQRWLLTGTLAFTALTLLAGWLIFRQYNRRKAEEAKALVLQQAAEKQVLENQVLRSQMNPHFIFNALGSISHHIRHHPPEEADAYLARFARLMRMVLENSEQEQVTLQEELDMLGHYVALEQQRMARPFDYTLQVDATIDTHNTMIPPLLLQPLLENSIWHGLAPLQDRPGQLTLHIGRNAAGQLHLQVVDNGTGMPAGQNTVPSTGHRSYGLSLVRRRLASLEPLQSAAGQLELLPLQPGTMAMVTLPYPPATLS